MKALLFAAGLGTRLKPFTDLHPKALAIVNGKPLLQRNIEYLQSFGIKEFVINIHHFGNQIIDFLALNNNFNSIIHISDEIDEVLETGGGLMKAKNFLEDSDFLVMNTDILTQLNLTKMIDFHYKNKPLVTLAVSHRESTRKILFDKKNQLCGWINLQTGEEIRPISGLNVHDPKNQVLGEFPPSGVRGLAFSGIHIINPNIFNLITETGKFSIMKSYMRLMETENILGFDHTGVVLIDVGKPEAIIKAEEIFK